MNKITQNSTEKTNKYQNGKIYKIIDNTNGNVYIGSTTQKLSSRLAGHVRDFKDFVLNGKRGYISSFDIIKNDDYDMVLIENFPCNNTEELHKRERHHVDSMECVNKIRPYISQEEAKQEHKEYNKEYQRLNKDKISKLKKEYNAMNKNKINTKCKEYYETNKELIKKLRKQRYEENKAKILAEVAVRVKCICGSTVRKGDTAKHERTQKHMKYMEQQQDNKQGN